MKRSFPNRKNDKNDKEIHTISTPAPQYQQTYPPLALIYQIANPPPHPPAYRTLYPPPPVNHPPQQQYRTPRPGQQYPQNRPQINQSQGGNRVLRHLTPLLESLSQILEKLYNANLITQVPPKPLTGRLPKNHDRYVRSEYHMNASRHDTKNCWALRHKL